MKNLFAKLRNKITSYSKIKKSLIELCEDLKNNYGFKEINVKILDNHKAVVSAQENGTVIHFNVDFSANKMTQTVENKKTLLLPWLPFCDNKTIINGTIDGKIKTIKNIERRSDRNGYYMETITYNNVISGNDYRKVKTPKRTEYSKLIGDKYINLFPHI